MTLEVSRPAGEEVKCQASGIVSQRYKIPKKARGAIRRPPPRSGRPGPWKKPGGPKIAINRYLVQLTRIEPSRRLRIRVVASPAPGEFLRRRPNQACIGSSGRSFRDTTIPAIPAAIRQEGGSQDGEERFQGASRTFRISPGSGVVRRLPKVRSARPTQRTRISIIPSSRQIARSSASASSLQKEGRRPRRII